MFCSKSRQFLRYRQNRPWENFNTFNFQTKRSATDPSDAIDDADFDPYSDYQPKKERFLEIVITRFLLRILTEHIESICRGDSQLFFVSICSIRILTRTRVIAILNLEISKKAKPEIREEPKVSSESDEGEVAERVEFIQEPKQQMRIFLGLV